MRAGSPPRALEWARTHPYTLVAALLVVVAGFAAFAKTTSAWITVYVETGRLLRDGQDVYAPPPGRYWRPRSPPVRSR